MGKNEIKSLENKYNTLKAYYNEKYYVVKELSDLRKEIASAKYEYHFKGVAK